MKTEGPVFEKSRSVEDLEHMRLMALLRELVRDKGVMKAAEVLEVDYRTLTSSLESGRLSRRMRTALDKALLEGGGSPAAEQRERNDRLEGGLKEVKGSVDELGKAVNKGLAGVQGDVKALRDDHDKVVQRLSRLEAGGDVEGAEEAVGEAEGAREGAGRPRRRGAPWREHPDLVTLGPADGDEEAFGEAWPLVVEWRQLKEAHPNRGKGLAWLAEEERLLEMELALLEEHGMTLPPEKQPLRDFARKGQVNWRRTALSDTRRARARSELLLWIRRVFTMGLWRR